ncbi:leucine-rich repeat-containing protein 17-like [Protopterus annectens]|uniref:leucine-rich repeat-containing protein 17-like n=1 Tax=Protopterus annectens TaxID=7888 RepID=UPI001CF9B0B3|nr:leucine-rich repeat-containing protein 17-like [Protopterus annectens]
MHCCSPPGCEPVSSCFFNKNKPKMIPLFLVTLVHGIHLHTLKACPHRCRCYDSSHFVDCKDLSLMEIPKAIPQGTWMLDLKHNNLSEVDMDSFGELWSMKILIISHNQINKICSEAFTSFGFLEKLDLSNNWLTELPQDFSNSLVSLRELKLSNNRLQMVKFGSLQHLEKLEKLDMSGNWVYSLEKGTFRGLSKLRYLYLQRNRITVLHNGLFFMIQNVEVLHLGGNNISTIEMEAFNSLHHITLLGLRNNQLTHLKFKTFSNIVTLGTHLQLSGNPWMCDCDLQRVFGKILSVRYLHVDDYDNITCASPAQLTGFPLKSVDTQLCIAETATVLVITITVLVTVVAAIVMAERNRKKRQQKNWNEPDTALESHEK